MNKEPLISVIIPTYKRSKMLKRAINSVLNQTYNKIEIIIVDDNNENSEYRIKTEEFMKQYENNNKIYYLKHRKNKGGSAARNTGIKFSNGQYIAFLDDDDIWLSHKLQKQVNKLNESKYKDDLAIIYCKIKYIDQNNNIIKNNMKLVKGNVLKDHIKGGIAPTSSLLIEKEILLKINGFRDLYCKQEYDLILRILKLNKKVDYVDEELLIVFIHDGLRISNNINRIKGTKYMYDIRKNYFHILTEEEENMVKQNHYLELFHFSLNIFGRKNSFKYLIKYIKISFFKIKNIQEILIFILGYDKSVRIKRGISKLYRKILKNKSLV